MEKKTKVYWTPQERELVIARLRGLFKEDINLDNKSALKHAQEVLPISRRRKVTPSFTWTLKKTITEARSSAITGAVVDDADQERRNAESSVMFNLMVEAVAEKIAARVMEKLK